VVCGPHRADCTQQLGTDRNLQSPAERHTTAHHGVLDRSEAPRSRSFIHSAVIY
jgi:hypothetical protein